jgi:hypothetical protein
MAQKKARRRAGFFYRQADGSRRSATVGRAERIALTNAPLIIRAGSPSDEQHAGEKPVGFSGLR